MPLLKKPLEAVGIQIKVPGSTYWAGKMTTEENVSESHHMSI